MSWETVVGLEVHVQLKTRSKMFCACSTDPTSPPNTNVCPVCLGLPGALPVPNDHAVRLAVRAALALGCHVADQSIFARKHYFYPDLPKGYQISQFEHPLAVRGQLDTGPEDGSVPVRIRRVHLEEDAGKSFHDRYSESTAVDLNRCGVPLIEIVSEPDVRSPDHARRYLNHLKQILEYLDVSECNMEDGSLRVDANLSVRRPGDPLGVRQEIKNMNSFSAVVRALEQLSAEQIRLIEDGGTIVPTTYSAGTGEVRAVRTKEESHDYRYFPDPDLPPVTLARYGVDADRERDNLPELPVAKRERFQAVHGVSAYDAEVLTASVALADYYETTVSRGANPKDAARWVIGPVLADAKEHGGAFRVAPARLAVLTQLVADGLLSEQTAKRVFALVADVDEDPRAVAERHHFLQVRDRRQIAGWMDRVLASHPDEVARYEDGEQKLLGFFVGLVMKESGGRADPKLVRSLIGERFR